MDINKIIKKQVKIYVNKQRKIQKGGEDAYDSIVGALNSFAHIAQRLKIPESEIPSGSSSGSVIALTQDIVGLVENTLNTIMETVIAADAIIALPSNLGKAYNEPIAHQKFNF